MKKGLLVIGALAIAIATVPMFAAFEAHVINVTAHIENALRVDTDPLMFGTVFPQEYVEKGFGIKLSSSFMEASRVDDVQYVINQKPKPTRALISYYNGDVDAARRYCIKNGADAGWPSRIDSLVEMGDCDINAESFIGCRPRACYRDLCPFLSKMDGDPEDNNDRGEPSYYDKATNTCPKRDPIVAGGYLSKFSEDTVDKWIVDLKVPPVAGYVGQDWPEGCPTVARDSQDYGCDLWIEVTGISES